MTDRNARRDAIFVEVVRLPPSQRDAFLDQACGPDGSLRAEIEDLLRHDADAPAGFLRGVRGDGADVAGRRIGPYEVVRELGRGGQGVVYLAKDSRLPRQVALKVVESGPLPSNELLRRFRREAAVASRLEHPGICGIHEAGLDDGIAYIAMRYVEGETLARKIAAAKGAFADQASCIDLSVAEVSQSRVTGFRSPTRTLIMLIVGMFERLSRALHVAHEAGVVHRDIKPGNVMVTPADEPVILDFGLAGDSSDDQPTITRPGEIFGTPGYMSPEQLTRQSIKVDRRTDVYSLGVALYETLTLRRPFEAPTREGLYQAILTTEAPDPRRFNSAIPTDLRVVVETAMEKDRDRRYQTAFDFAEDLRRVRELEPILAKPAGWALRLRRWSQRNPALATALIGLFATLASGLVISLVLLGATESQRARADANATERAAALADYDRLGDLSRLRALIAEADQLWPCERATVPAMHRGSSRRPISGSDSQVIGNCLIACDVMVARNVGIRGRVSPR